MRPHVVGLFAFALWVGAAQAQSPGRSMSPQSPQPPYVPPTKTVRQSLPATPTLRTFDCLTTEINRGNNHWAILADGAVLKEFNTEADARTALGIIRELKLNQYGVIGSPPIMEYWLVDGHAPFGAGPNLRLVDLDLNTLHVEELDNQWCLRDKQRLLFNFGVNRAEAYLALDVVRHYGFTQLGRVGQFIPSMLYFLGSRADQDRPPSLPVPQLGAGQTWQPGQRGVAKRPPGVARIGFAQKPVRVEPQTEHVRFDFRRVEVRRDKNEWKLVCDNHVLANFGANQQDARLAWNTIQHYHFSEHCLIGRPHASFSYYLIGGQAPRGLMFGIMTQPFHPETVVVRQQGQGWGVYAGDQPLVAFGHIEEARELEAAIQQYRFDHLCRIGNAQGQGMTFFVRAR